MGPQIRDARLKLGLKSQIICDPVSSAKTGQTKQLLGASTDQFPQSPVHRG